MKIFLFGIMFAISQMGGHFKAVAAELYDIGTPLESRSISFENPTGQKGAGAQAKSRLGIGRKGSPNKWMRPGQNITLCDIDGPGVIRHIWLTFHVSIETLQGIVIQAFWDNQKHPSIETPIGPFFGVMHGQLKAYQSAVHSVNSTGGFNCWIEMPFKKHAKIVLKNESTKWTPIYYNIDYTIRDTLPRILGYLHAAYRRENPTELKNDFVILPKREGRGRFLGCVLGIRNLSSNWWGEGEFKVYLDGDKGFPTICNSGTEDYVGQAWGIQDTSFFYGGTSLRSGNLTTIYRWHIKDPIYWKKDIRITIQQIGYSVRNGLFDRQDDVSVCSFWYEPEPSKPLAELPGYAARIKDYIPMARETGR